MSDDEDKCPVCGGEQIGIEVRGVYDGILFWTCPSNHRWHRFPVGDYWRNQAEPYVKGDES